MPHMSHDCSPNYSPFHKGRKASLRHRKPENQVLLYDVSINLLPALGGEFRMFKVVALVARFPTASLIVPVVTSGGFFVLVYLGFCLFWRK